MARQRSPATAFQQPKAIVQAPVYTANAECRNPTGRHLDRKRVAIKFLADLSDKRSIGVAQLKTIDSGAHALDEKLYGGLSERFGRGKEPGCRRTLKRR